jgi:hypothetical protein
MGRKKASASPTMQTPPSTPDAPRKRGRPPLSPEERARREKQRQEAQKLTKNREAPRKPQKTKQAQETNSEVSLESQILEALEAAPKPSEEPEAAPKPKRRKTASLEPARTRFTCVFNSGHKLPSMRHNESDYKDAVRTRHDYLCCSNCYNALSATQGRAQLWNDCYAITEGEHKNLVKVNEESDTSFKINALIRKILKAAKDRGGMSRVTHEKGQAPAIFTLPPREAALAAYAIYIKKDPRQESYEENYGKLIKASKDGSVTCGPFTAVAMED